MSWTITIYEYNDLQAQWVISMEHMKEKGLVEHKVEVPAHTLILAQLSFLHSHIPPQGREPYYRHVKGSIGIELYK